MIRDQKQNVVFTEGNMKEHFSYSDDPYVSNKMLLFYYPCGAGYDDIFSLRHIYCSKFIYPFWIIGYTIKSKLYKISSVVEGKIRRM